MKSRKTVRAGELHDPITREFRDTAGDLAAKLAATHDIRPPAAAR